jgi:hypothetical protein
MMFPLKDKQKPSPLLFSFKIPEYSTLKACLRKSFLGSVEDPNSRQRTALEPDIPQFPSPPLK